MTHGDTYKYSWSGLLIWKQRPHAGNWVLLSHKVQIIRKLDKNKIIISQIKRIRPFFYRHYEKKLQSTSEGAFLKVEIEGFEPRYRIVPHRSVPVDFITVIIIATYRNVSTMDALKVHLSKTMYNDALLKNLSYGQSHRRNQQDRKRLKKLHIFAEKGFMTQIVLNIENQSIAASLKKVLATMEGVSIASSRTMSPYEKSRMEADAGKVNTYSSVDDMFSKLGL